MQTTWDLTVLYPGLDSPAFAADMERLSGMLSDLKQAFDAFAAPDGPALPALVRQYEEAGELLERLLLMAELTLSCNAQDAKADAALSRLLRENTRYRQVYHALCRLLASLDFLEERIEAEEALRARAFALREAAQRASHLLPPALEEPVLRMQLSGGEALSQLREKLEATLTADYRGETLPLSAVRALAYDADASVRRDAYQAELAAYQKVELPMSTCLNSIKAEGQTMAHLRGYDGILSMTLHESRVDPRALDAMLTALREALPGLRRYFRAKARLLGHTGGLPFYDLFAPVGKNARTYTIEQTRDLLLEVFGRFSPEMAEMMKTAFDEGWIDVYPRPGKRGGAFCCGCHALNISRILTNFAGSLSDVSTLAHELGHAFHDRMLAGMPRMMIDVPMPLAETASTFNETLLSAALRAQADPSQALTLLDAQLMETTQTLVDIYSRFLFEQRVVAAQEDHALSVEELKQTMLWAQEQAYGDGLDPRLRHPYMWVCKSHYYATDMHFYNFPYAFGCLFARGLYARYEREGEAFVPSYCRLLSLCGSGTVAQIAAGAGIDVCSPGFWQSALAGVLEDVRAFEELAT